MVELRGLVPWADTHGKQWVSTVLSAVESADLRKLFRLLASPQAPYAAHIIKQSAARKSGWHSVWWSCGDLHPGLTIVA